MTSDQYPMTPSKRIYVIGMMGAGKTTIGKKIARLLGYSFVDLDSEIEKHEGISVQQIFEKNGEEYFRKLESAALRRLSGTDLVIATGGGTPCYFDNMKYILDTGISIYLKAEPSFIFQRVIRFPAKRPLLQGKSGEEIRHFLEQKIAEREQWYLQATHVFQVPAASAETIVKSMV